MIMEEETKLEVEEVEEDEELNNIKSEEELDAYLKGNKPPFPIAAVIIIGVLIIAIIACIITLFALGGPIAKN